MITGQQFVDEARKWLTVPFYHTGRNKYGVDCCGLIICTLHGLGLYTDFDDRNYSFVVPDGRMRKCIDMFCDELPLDNELQIGDIILMRVAGHQQHIAIYTGNNCMIHSYQSAKCVAEHIITKQWHNRIIGKFKLRDIK